MEQALFVVGHASRGGAHRRAPDDLSRRDIEGHDRASPAERDVRATCRPFDDAARLIRGLELDLGQEGHRCEIREHDAIAIRIGGDRGRPVCRDEERAAADGRRRSRRRDRGEAWLRVRSALLQRAPADGSGDRRENGCPSHQ
jgi:hypothetical protein